MDVDGVEAKLVSMRTLEIESIELLHSSRSDVLLRHTVFGEHGLVKVTEQM